MLNFYQKYISSKYHILGQILFGESFGCRYTPTCSEYARIALKKHGIIQGSLLGIKRFLRCNPFFEGGVDNVPDKPVLGADKIN